MLTKQHDVDAYKDHDFPQPDPVERPAHYMLLPGVEVRDVIKALVGKFGQQANPMIISDYVQMMQYGMRFMQKNGLEDLKKMRWYLDKIIEQHNEQSQTYLGYLRSGGVSSLHGTGEQSGESRESRLAKAYKVLDKE